MNNSNVLKLINTINDETNFFHMGSWTIMPIELDYPEHFKQRYEVEPPSCGTPSCIGGWVENLSKTKEESEMAVWLGITETMFEKLCYPIHKDYNEISRQDAIDTLENLYITGEVTWDTTSITR